MKIREIAVTLLDCDETTVPNSEVAQNAKQYIEAFIDILTALDYPSKQVVALNNSTSPDGLVNVTTFHS